MSTANPQSGDLVFFPSSGSLGDKLILWRTKPGPFVHVEICTAPAESIGATARGVVRHPLPPGGTMAPTRQRCDAKRLAAALEWLGKQVNAVYGWGDILDDGWSLVAPSGPFVVFRRRFDCSHLAACVLAIAGYPLPGDVLANLELVTPNGLARAVGLLDGQGHVN